MTEHHRLLHTGRWRPPSAPPEQGRTATTKQLTVAGRLPAGNGPEDVIFDRDGHILTGLADGSILRINPATAEVTTLGNTGGRPLGLQPAHNGDVLICDHDRGLLRMTVGGSVEVLVDTVACQPLRFASNVVEASDGTIWFTVSTRRWTLEHFLGDIFEHSCTGMLVQRDPDGRVTVLRDDLKFGNGLALSADETHLLFAESEGYRINRYWLRGDKIGTTEPFAHNLPGLPDNISLGSDGLLWVSIAAPRNPLLDRLLPLPGILRTLLWNVPEAVRPKATPIAWVMAFDTEGQLVHDLRSEDGTYDFVTSVAEHDGLIVAGSLHADHIITIALGAE